MQIELQGSVSARGRCLCSGANAVAFVWKIVDIFVNVNRRPFAKIFLTAELRLSELHLSQRNIN